ncbi:MAG TPA: FecR domain-containing protein, partial [Flavisolibacter sp.]|nr:FecR domain-containing protein [Flavisolibacter sp.]
ELEAWLADSETNRLLFSEINDPNLIAEYLDKIGQFDEEGTWKKIIAYQKQSAPLTNKTAKKSTHLKNKVLSLFPLYGIKWKMYAAAAVLILCLSTGIILYWQMSSRHSAVAENKAIDNDILPGKDQAILTLADGKRIVLDSNSNGTIAKQGGITIINLKGKLNYKNTKQVPNTAVYNTIETGRGNQYEIMLADGSIVWLNASSSLRFPASFTGNERNVTLTGEGYFSVAKDINRPFTVLFNNTSVKVLGTEFNVMAYTDEPGGTQTTLIRGSVSINQGQHQMKLVPGKMAVVNDSGIRINSNVDIEQVIAWKNGQISLNNADLKMVMRQISRWYDVEVKYEGPVNQIHIGGFVDRNVNLNAILDFLSENGVHIKRKGRELIILK